MTKKIKIISTLATLSFISPSLSPPLSLSLSLSLLSLNFSPKTGVDAITKTGLSDLFAGQTDLGSFSSAPTKASLLYRCKSIINSFHNENDSWYTITNLTSTSCTLSATDRNPFYSSSVNFDFVIGSLTPLANVISSNISQTVTTDVWDSTTDDFNIKKIFGDTFSLNMNQIDVTHNDNDYKSQNFINSLYTTTLGGTATMVFNAQVTFSAKPNSTLYSGSVTRTFPLSIKIQDFNYTGASQTFTAPIDATYLMETWGAGGGYKYSNGQQISTTGGAYTSGFINLEMDDNIYAYVGGQGMIMDLDNRTIVRPGGWNGGSDLKPGQQNCVTQAGNGATDFRLAANNNTSYPSGWNDPLSLNSRIMVAAGSGGTGIGASGSSGSYEIGVCGGTIEGFSDGFSTGATKYWVPLVDNLPRKATQIGGGVTPASLWSGGFGSSISTGFGVFGSGAGGGYYTGSMNQNPAQGTSIGIAGGSCSFISGYSGCVAIADPLNNVTVPNRIPKTTGNTTALTFYGQDWVYENPFMAAGNASMHLWNSTTSGGTMTGNNALGHARIYWIG